MFGLSQDLKRRMAFYKSKMPTHGKTLYEVMKNYSSPAYESREASPSYHTMEDMKAGKNPKGYYGFPELGKIPHGPKASDFGTVFGFRVCCAGSDSGTEYSRRDTIGYYADNFQMETIVPLVFRLNHGRGFLIGHYMTDNGEVYVAVSEGIYSDMRSAFHAAHSYAESLADDSREAQAKDQADMQIGELHAEIRDAGKAILALIKEYKSFPMRESLQAKPAITQALKDTICGYLADRRKAFKRIEALQDNYWLAVE